MERADFEDSQLRHSNEQTRLVLVAGPVRPAGRKGHHDYLAGCRLIADMLEKVPGVAPVVVVDGWPVDESVFDDAGAVLFYDNGGGKQGFLATPARRAKLVTLAEKGCGLGLLHQAAGFPAEQAAFGQALFGGVYVAGASRRGHWRSRHRRFAGHPVTRTLGAWRMRDGWLNDIRFVDEKRSAITPLLWSDKRRGCDPQAGDAAIVSWAYAPAGRGRAFVFTGGDNHRVWRHESVRRLVAGGLLWSAGRAISDNSEWSRMASARVAAYRTPRRSPIPRAMGSLGRRLRRALSGRRKW